MLLNGPGSWKFNVTAGPNHSEYACVTASEKAVIEIFHNDVIVDLVYLGHGCTHTWWSTNPLLVGSQNGDRVYIRIAGTAAMRIEWPFQLVEASATTER